MSFISKSTNFLNNIANNINQNKYFYGIMMILLNVGSKYLSVDLSSPSITSFLSTTLMRRVIIFSIVFIATRDIKISLILTACFIVFTLNLFNDKSKYCILPKSFRNLDTNLDGEISPQEIERAYRILKKTGKLPNNNKEL